MDFYLLIPYYNDFERLVDTLKSVVYSRNTYGIVIVDDGSTEPLTEADVRSFCACSSLTILRLDKNLGITSALNTGLRWLRDRSNYKYIARLDCGDICHADRFDEQVEFLDRHSNV